MQPQWLVMHLPPGGFNTSHFVYWIQYFGLREPEVPWGVGPSGHLSRGGCESVFETRAWRARRSDGPPLRMYQVSRAT